MNLIIDFYKDLDTINLIIFWGIILIILLLLIFSIIIANKNKKLKRIIYTKEQEIDKSKNETVINQNITNETENINLIEDTDTFLPPKEDTNETITINETKNDNIELPKEEIIINKEEAEKEKNIIINNKEENNIYITKEEELPIKEEFIAEEYVKPTKEIIIPNAPYQRNVLREMSLSQTSPIGITKKEPNPQKEILNNYEPQTTIQNIEIIEDSLSTETYKNNYREEMNNSKKMINKIYEEEKNINKNIQTATEERNNYLQELKEKLEESAKKDEIERTAYEIKQEEEAIISYDELMKKKDTLKIEDEEEAVISIEELRRKKMEQERIYNITKDEENDEFISELKDFRSDL